MNEVEINFTDIDAEGVVLGSLMADAEICSALLPNIARDDFGTLQGCVIFDAITEASRKGLPADFVTVTQLLRDAGKLEDAGGPVAVTLIATADLTRSLASAQHQAERLRTLAIDREAAGIAQHLANAAYGRKPFEQMQYFASMWSRLQQKASEGATLPGKSLMDFAGVVPDPAKTVLGNRFLCAGGGMLFVGPSGIGKSSASVQQDILWSLGREAFGIRPARPLNVLTIQAENDDGDIGEMATSVADGLELTAKEMQAVRVHYVTEDSRTGDAFLAMLPKLLSGRKFDLLRIDPFLAYLGGDILDTERTAAFLRNGLNPILRRFGVACILNHHTPKTNNRDTSNYRASDWMYAGTGNADITNWARAALVIEPTHAPHVFKFIAAKRGNRIGWVDDNAQRELIRHFCHAEAGIYWREARPEDLQDVEDAIAAKKTGKAMKTPEDFKRLVPNTGSVSKFTLLETARKSGFTKRGAEETLDVLLEAEELYVWALRRAGARPEIHISRQEQELKDVA